jgi:predicted SnoaL-like aldol condensation-catalyzing enzyme
VARLDDIKAIVLDFYEQLVNRRDFEAASRHLGEVYVQHRADAEDGLEGLRRFVERMRDRYPQSQCTVKRVVAEGDLVVLHVHVVREPGALGSKHVDIFRVDGDKVVEHWDIDQPIELDAVNTNGPF